MIELWIPNQIPLEARKQFIEDKGFSGNIEQNNLVEEFYKATVSDAGGHTPVGVPELRMGYRCMEIRFQTLWFQMSLFLNFISPRMTLQLLFPIFPTSLATVLCELRALSRVETLRTHLLQPARLLCPWDSSGKNTGAGCCFLPQEVFPTQALNPSLALAGRFITSN